MPSEIRLSDFRRWFQRQGVEFHAGAKHTILKRKTKEGRTRFYTLPLVRGRYVKYAYLHPARKALGLTAEDGFADSLFE